MAGDTFTIDLVSNGSMDIFTDNTLSKFQNQIDPALELDGNWEVALTEIYFPVKFSNGLPKKIDFHLLSTTVYTFPNINMDQTAIPYWTKYSYTGNDYASSINVSPDESLNGVIDKLNIAMEENLKRIRPAENFDRYPKFICENGKTTFQAGRHVFEFDKAIKLNYVLNGSVQDIVNKYKKNFNIDLNEIGNLIGDRSDRSRYYKFYYKGRLIEEIVEAIPVDIYKHNEKYKSYSTSIVVPKFSDASILQYLGFNALYEENMYNIDMSKKDINVTTPLIHAKNVNLMYIYTDIIRDHVVGGIQAPVLRAVPLTTGIYDGIGYCTFENRIYYPARKNHIENIMILCLDDTGEQIKFANIGRVFVSLDFRKKELI